MAADPEKIEQERGFKTENRTASQPNTIADRLQAQVSPEAKQKIQNILDEVNKFNDLEKLLLYLKLPAGITDTNAATQNKTPTPVAVARAEQTQAFNWIRSHLEESSDTSLPKHEVYEDYKSYCENSSQHVLSPADFGKIMKSMFPNVKGRRLGTRGNSRYCYSGIRKKTEVKPPVLPTLDSPQKLSCRELTSPSLCWKCQNSPDDEQVDLATSLVVCEYASKVFPKQFSSILDVADYLTHHGLVTKSMAALTVISYMAERNKKSSVDPSLLRFTQSPEDRHREMKHQLQRKIQHSQLIKMKQQQENRKKLQNKLGSATENTHSSNVDRTKTELRSQSVPADRLFSESDSNSSNESGNDMKDNTDAVSSNPSVPIAGVVSQPPPAGVKDSPKRRYTPIQPKTPVRDPTIKAVPINMPNINIAGIPKGQQGQAFLLRNPNGTMSLAMEVVQNGQKVLQLINTPVVQQPVSAASATPAVASPPATSKSATTTPVSTKPMSQIVLVRQAPSSTNLAQGAGISPVVQTSKSETIAANAAILVSPNHHVLVSPVKAPSSARVSASVAQMVSSPSHVVVQNAPTQVQGKMYVNRGSIVSPPSQHKDNTMPAQVLSPTAANLTQMTIKKEVVSRGPTPSIENIGSPPATTANASYTQPVLGMASPVSEIKQSVAPGGLVTSQVLQTVTTNSITTPQSTAICLSGMTTTSSIPHAGSAAALLKELSSFSTVNANNNKQSATAQVPLQRSSLNQAQLNQVVVKQQHNVPVSATATVQTKVLPEINDTASQLQQVAATLQLQQQKLLQQQQQQQQLLQQQQQQQQVSLQPMNLTANSQTTGILKTVLMSSIPVNSSTQQQMTLNNTNIAATSETVAKLDALQLHDNNAAAQITRQRNQSGQTIPIHVAPATAGSQQQLQQHPGFIPVSGVKRLAVDPQSSSSSSAAAAAAATMATVFTNGATIPMGSIQQKQQQQQQVHGFAGTAVVGTQSGVSQRITLPTGQSILTTGTTTSGCHNYINIKSADGTVSMIPVSQLQQLISTQQVVNTAPSVGRSVPCTPTSDMQSQVPLTMMINPQATSIMQQQASGHVSGHVTPVNVMHHQQPPSGHVTPVNVMQQTSGHVSGHVTPVNVMQTASGHATPVHMMAQNSCGGTTTPIPMCTGPGSVPPSPIDVSAGFIPIQQGIDQSRLASNASPVKRTKVKPRPTHPKQQGAELGSQGNQQVSTSIYQQNEITNKPNFAAPSRKRRPSGQRRVNTNPYPLPPGPRQTTPAASPCNSRSNTPVSPATPGNPPNFDSISMPPPSPGLPPFDNTVMGGSRDLRNRSASPALWNSQRSARQRNPSGPPTYTMQQNNRQQQSIEPGTINQTNLNLNQIVLDQNGHPKMVNRSQSVPLPDLPEARIFNFQQLQQLQGAQQPSVNQGEVLQPDFEKVLQGALQGTELRGIQINDTNYNAKRNLTLELKEIEVTEDDFAVGPSNPQNFLSPDGNSQSGSGIDAFNELLNSNPTSQQSDQSQEAGQGSPWPSSSSRRGDPTLSSAPTAPGASDLNFEIASSDPAVSTGSSGLPEDQALLFNQSMNGDASNSTASTLNDDMPSMDDPLQMSDFGQTNFDLSWQMGSNSNLSTLECGM